MSKIICDVCGTSYPETATQCPICGYVNSGNTQGVSGDTQDNDFSGGYNYVKGGRFSKSNVRKRNQGKGVQPAVRNTTAAKFAQGEEREPKSTKGLVITAVVLMLAIIAVVAYVAVRFFGTGGTRKPSDLDTSVPVSNSTTEATVSQPAVIPCESIQLDVANITFDKLNTSRMIYATPSPANTTDTITYKSDNESVATVTPDGKVTAVGSGQATITITCGKAIAKCTVASTAEDPTADTQNTTTPSTTESKETLRLNRQDITFKSAGDTWVLYNGNIGKTQITWSSDDPSVAKFEGGKVTAVGGGMTKVHAEYNGQKVSCIIRCTFSGGTSKPGIDGNGGGVSEDGGGSSAGNSGGSAKIYSQFGAPVSDVTIGVGDSLKLTLKDSSGKTVDATWTINGSGCTLSGNSVTGATSGSRCTVSTTYNGTTYSCVVRVG